MTKRKILDYDGLQTYDSTIKEYIEAKTANLGNAVLTTAQELTDEQKAQTRANIEVKPTDLVAKITNEYVSGTGIVYSCDTPFVDLWAAYEAGRDVFFNIVDMIFVKADFVITASQSDSEIKHVRASLINGANHQLYIVKEDDTVSFTTYSYITKSDMKQETGTSKVLPMSQKAVTDALALKADKTALDEAIDAIPQSDWNQNDETASDYVKNRPFGEKTSRTDYLNPIEITGFRLDSSDTKYYTVVLEEDEYIKLASPVIVGESYKVVWDGQVYNATLYEDDGLNYFGRNYYYLHDNPDNLPFGIALDTQFDEETRRRYSTEMRIIFTDSSTAETHTLEIYKENVEINYLDPKYIKDMYYTGDPVETPIVEETTFELADGMGNLTATQPLEVGQEYIINLDGVQYNAMCKEINLDGMVLSYLGNLVVAFPDSGIDTGEPFFIAPMDSNIKLGIMVNSDVTEHTVSIIGNIVEINHLNPKYIKDMYYEYITPNTDLVLDTYLNAEGDNWWFSTNDFYLESFLVEGATYIATCNNETYTCTARRSNYGEVYIGNQSVADWSEGSFPEIIESNEPFFLYAFEEEFDYGLRMQTAGEYNIVIEGTGEKLTPHKIDMKYMPDSITYGIRDQWDEINNIYDNLNNINADSKMDKKNPVGTGSFSMNRKDGTTIGNCSHAEGNQNEASGENSHAEGQGTIASEKASHAEGWNTTASGECQHVQGRYNIEDTEDTYAHIVGNGESEDTRSNAHTLDWEGNAWYQGDVYVGSASGTNRDEGSKKLASEEYVDAKFTNGFNALILLSPNGTRFNITVGDDGVLSATEITE